MLILLIYRVNGGFLRSARGAAQLVIGGSQFIQTACLTIACFSSPACQMLGLQTRPLGRILISKKGILVRAIEYVRPTGCRRLSAQKRAIP